MSEWKDFVTAALLGTAQGAPPALPDELAPVQTGSDPLEREVQFLTRAGALALWRRAGWKAPHTDTGVAAALPETLPVVSRVSAGHLRIMLEQHCAAVLPEWLEAVACSGLRVPPELVPSLLERARTTNALRPLVVAVAGHRAAWLAEQNPAWRFAAENDPELWDTGTAAQRLALLLQLRAEAPGVAREKLQAVWSSEPADQRAALLATFEENLSADDEALLETALDDRSQQVRRVAVDLLARLPASQFVARMTARATPLLVFKPARILGRASLEVTLPDRCDASATRDGLDPKAFGRQKKLGERAVVLVQLLAAVPPDHWTSRFQLPVVDLLKVAARSEFALALATGWAWAAHRQRDAVWAAALLDGPLEPCLEFLPAEPLFAVLPEAQRADRLQDRISKGALDKPGSDDWARCLSELTLLAAWPEALTRAVIAALQKAAANGVTAYWRVQFEVLLLRIPPALLPEAIAGWPVDQPGVAALLELLNFRQDALTALHQPE